jgi:spore coat polysaccharide biosynthesis protein SpsF
MTRVGIITQARMTSTRLPGKVLLPAGGQTMLGHHVRRLGASGHPVYVATTTNATDDVIAQAAPALGAEVHRGSEDDVLSRFAATAAAFDLDVIVRVTSDCPLIDGTVIRDGVTAFLELHDDEAYLSNTIRRTYPRGLDFEVFSASALHDAQASVRDSAGREHVTPFFYRNDSGRTTVHQVERSGDASHYRLTLDTVEDYALLRFLIENHRADELGAEELIALMERHPSFARLNAHIEQKKLGG